MEVVFVVVCCTLSLALAPRPARAGGRSGRSRARSRRQRLRPGKRARLARRRAQGPQGNWDSNDLGLVSLGRSWPFWRPDTRRGTSQVRPSRSKRRLSYILKNAKPSGLLSIADPAPRHVQPRPGGIRARPGVWHDESDPRIGPGSRPGRLASFIAYTARNAKTAAGTIMPAGKSAGTTCRSSSCRPRLCGRKAGVDSGLEGLTRGDQPHGDQVASARALSEGERRQAGISTTRRCRPSPVSSTYDGQRLNLAARLRPAAW